MDIESVSKVNSNYGTAEAVKITNTSADASRAAAVEVERSAEMASKAVTAIEESGFGDGKKEHTPSEATIDDAVKSANRKMMHTRCEYSYHKKTNRVSIKVLDADTQEVIREIPPEKSLDMLQKMWELAGILVDEKR